jgi:N utilization substance protein B
MKINLLNREDRINALYYHYLFRWDYVQLVNNEAKLQLDDSQLNTIRETLNNQKELESLIKANLREDWPWENISPLIQAILINAVAEIKLFDNKIAIVIKESNKYTARYVGQEPISMITALLNNIK